MPQVHDKSVQVRLTAREERLIMRAAKREDKYKSVWIRDAAVKAAAEALR